MEWKNLFKASINKKVFLVLLLVSMLPALLLSYITYDLAKSTIEQQVIAHLNTIGDIQKENIERVAGELRTNLLIAQGYYNVRYNLPRLSAHLNETSHPEFVDAVKMLDSQLARIENLSKTLNFLDIVDLELVNSDGIVVYNTNKGHSSFEFGKKSKAIFEKEHIAVGKSHVDFSDVFNSVGDGHKLSMYASVGAFDLDDTFIGAINFEVDLTKVYEKLQTASELGNTGEVYVGKRVGDEMLILSPLQHLNGAAVIRTVRIGASEAKGIQQAVQGFDGSGQYGIDYRGVPVIGAWRYVPSFDWGIVTKIDVEEAFAPITVLKKKSLFLLLAIFVLDVLISILVSREITAPINQLASTAMALESRNFDVRTNIKRKDELGMLAKVFDNAIIRLCTLDKERKKLEHAKSQFLSVTGHELRSPMTPMRAQLQMLKENYFGKLNAQQKNAVEIILRNTFRLDVAITDLLEASRIETLRLKFNYAKMALLPFIKEAFRDIFIYLPEKKIKMVHNISRLPVFAVDPDRVVQVLKNLMINAKQFSYPGGKVVVSAKLSGKNVLFAVKDWGIGISPAGKKKIFTPFFQEGKTGGVSGISGLGLTICKALVEAMGGRIWFESEEGRGSTFYFTVPLVPPRKIKTIPSLFAQARTEDVIRD